MKDVRRVGADIGKGHPGPEMSLKLFIFYLESNGVFKS